MTCYFWWLGKKVRNFAKAIIKNSSSFYRESDDGEKAIKNGLKCRVTFYFFMVLFIRQLGFAVLHYFPCTSYRFSVILRQV